MSVGLSPEHLPKTFVEHTARAVRHAVRAGDVAPSFRLENMGGGSTALVDLIGVQPLVLSFYRGIWCSFCDTVLTALSGLDASIRDLGAAHVAIGPPPDDDDQQARLAALSMPVLIDRGLRVTSAYGLTMTLPDDLRNSHAEAGFVPASPGNWKIPIPATYIIERGGRVALAAIDIDYRNRLDPAQLLSALEGVRRQAR